LERTISENNKELRNCFKEIREERKNEDEKVQPKLKDKIEDNCKDINVKVDQRINDVTQIVQVEDDNCTEENLKRQGEKAAQLNIKTNNLQDKELNESQVHDVTMIQDTSRSLKIENLQTELLEGLDMTQVEAGTLIQNTSRNIQISLTQTDQGIVKESTNEKTSNYRRICLFKKYACSFRTVIGHCMSRSI
jgi:hypothetical protein